LLSAVHLSSDINASSLLPLAYLMISHQTNPRQQNSCGFLAGFISR
jgi:hypothetical protein